MALSSVDEKQHPFSSPLGHDHGIGTSLVYAQRSFWAGNVWTNPLSGYDGSMTATFDGVSNTVGGIQSGDWIAVLPINLAYGSSTASYTWIQFAVSFNYGGSVDFVLEQNNYANGQMDYGSYLNGREWSTSPGIYFWQGISVHYVVGHTFLAQLFVTDSTHVEFAITDESNNPNSFWGLTLTVPSTKVLYMYSAFSPATTVEGLISNSVTAITGLPYFETDIINSMSSYSDNSGGVPSGVYYDTIDTFSAGYWRWCSLSSLGLIPTPVIQRSSLSYPSTITLGQTAVIDVPVTNTGGTASWMTAQISFPTNPPASALAIDYGGTSSSLNPNLYTDGSTISCGYGFRIGSSSSTVTTQYPLIEGACAWSGGTTKYLEVRVTPTTAGNFQFLVKSVAAYQSHAIDWDPTISTLNTVRDQQAEYTYSYSITVVPQYYLTVSSAYDSPSPTSGWFNSGTSITDSVSSPVAGPTGTRYVCTGWTGSGSVPASGTGTTVTFTINQASTITWNWKTQYYLTVSSAYDSPGGSGWYDSGTLAYASLSSGTVSGGTGVQYVFTGWSSDASGTGLVSSSITMNGAKTATANWKTQYYFTVSSAYGTTTGQNWYDAGSTAHAGLNIGTVSGGSGKQYVFTGWSGDASGSNYAQSSGVVMTAPRTAIANWDTQYQVTLSYQVSGGGSPTAPSVTYYLVGLPQSITAGPSATVWADFGSTYTYSPNPLAGSTGSERWQASGTSGTISSSLTISPIYYHQYQVTASYSTSDGSTPSASVVLSGTQCGSALPTTLQTSAQYVWLDAGSGWSVNNPITSSSQRWAASAGTSGTVSGAMTVAPLYTHQYQLTISGNFGSVSPDSGSWFNAGSAVTIYAVSPAVGSGEHYVWNGWTGSGSGSYTGTGNNSALVTMNAPVTETASWTHQYQITMSANFGTVSPTTGSWYNAGTSVTIYAVSPSVGNGEQYVWNGWTGTGTGSYSGSGNNSALVTMNAQVSESASWTHQYYLTVTSTYGTTTGQGWYNAGATAYAGLTSGTVSGGAGTGVQYVFSSWSTGGTSYSQSNAITMNSAVTSTASWITQYQVTFKASNLDSTAQGTIVTVSSYAVSYSSLPYSIWVNGGSQATFTFTSTVSSSTGGKQFVLSSVNSTSPLTMNAPVTVAGSYGTQYYLTVSSPFGNPSGQGWYNSGAVAYAGLDTGLINGTNVRSVFSSWAGGASGSNYAQSNPITMTSAVTATASWATQYLLQTSGNVGTVSPTSGSWYNAGTQVTIYAVPPSVGSGEQYVWNGWAGSGTGSYTGTGNNSALVTMNGPVNESASWTHQWQITFQQSGLSSDASGTVLMVGSSSYTYNTFPGSPMWVNDGASYSFVAAVPAGSGKQYASISVVGPTSPLHSSGTVSASYMVQYQLTISSNLGYVSPVSGTWFNAGSPVIIYAVSPATGSGARFAWNGWTGSGSGSYSGPGNNSALLTMNGPITEYASWSAQYQLTISGNFGSVGPLSGTWFDAGTPVIIYAVSPSVSSGERYVWNGWTGSGTGSYSGTGNNSALVTMNGPVTESASWNHQYQLTFVVTPLGSASLVPTGSNVWINSGPLSISATPDSGYTFSQWTSNTVYITFDDASAMSTTAEVNGPGTITASLTATPPPTPSPTPVPTPTTTSKPALTPTPSPTPTPLAIANSTATVSGNSATVNQTATTGVSVTVSGSSLPNGATVNVTSTDYGSSQPQGTGTISVGSAVFYDVKVTSSSGALGSGVSVTVSISNPSFSSASFLMYWDGSSWVSVATTFTAPDTVSATLPASALGGTLIAVSMSAKVPEFPQQLLWLVLLVSIASATMLIAILKRKKPGV